MVIRHASLTLQVRPPMKRSDTLCPDNGGDTGPDYWPSNSILGYWDVRRATPGPIHRRRWYRASTLPRLSRPRFDGYYSRSRSLAYVLVRARV